MKSNRNLCTDVGRLLRYDFRTKGARANEKVWIAAGAHHTATAAELTLIFKSYAAIRQDVKRPYWHGMLALHGERLTRRVWSDVSRFALEELGLDPRTHMFVAIVHDDESVRLQHCHLVACRVDVEGRLWSSRWDAYRLIEITQKIEVKFRLRFTKGLQGSTDELALSSSPIPPSRKVVNANRHATKKGLRPVDPNLLWPRLQRSAELATDVDNFIEMCLKVSIKVDRNFSPTGELRGLSVCELDGDIFVSLSGLTSGRMSLPKLTKVFESRRLNRIEQSAFDSDRTRIISELAPPSELAKFAPDFKKDMSDTENPSDASLRLGSLDGEHCDTTAEQSVDELLDNPESSAVEDLPIVHEDYLEFTIDSEVGDEEHSSSESDRDADRRDRH